MKEIRGHQNPATKQRQHHWHIRAMPYGRQSLQPPQTSRAEGIESGPPEETTATTKAQQANLCAAIDAPRFHHQLEELPQTGSSQAQGAHRPIFHTLHKTSVYKTPNDERHHPQLEGSTPPLAPRTRRGMYMPTVQGKIPRQPA